MSDFYFSNYEQGERRWLDPTTGDWLTEPQVRERYPHWLLPYGMLMISHVDRETRSITCSGVSDPESVPTGRSFWCPRFLQPALFWFLRRFGGR